MTDQERIEQLEGALREAMCWVPDGTRRTYEERGAKCETVYELQEIARAALSGIPATQPEQPKRKCGVGWKFTGDKLRAGESCGNAATHRAIATNGHVLTIFHVCEECAKNAAPLKYEKDHPQGMLAGDPLWVIIPPLAATPQPDTRDALDSCNRVACQIAGMHVGNCTSVTRLQFKQAELSESLIEKLAGALEALFALVQGECPGLLEDDHHFVIVISALADWKKWKEERG